jgi:hypothetical protein
MVPAFARVVLAVVLVAVVADGTVDEADVCPLPL